MPDITHLQILFFQRSDKMKSAFRYVHFLWIITASINNVNAENLTFMVGDDAGVGNLNGPSGDKLISFSYPVGGVNNIVFYNPTSTIPQK